MAVETREVRRGLSGPLKAFGQGPSAGKGDELWRKSLSKCLPPKVYGQIGRPSALLEFTVTRVVALQAWDLLFDYQHIRIGRRIGRHRLQRTDLDTKAIL